MQLTDIANRFLIMNGEMADVIDYTYDAGGMVTKEVRQIKTRNGDKTIIRQATITYTRDGSGLITNKTIEFETTQFPIP